MDIPPVVVIGLGRFGTSLANELMMHGVEVHGIDSSEKLIRDYAPYLTEATVADSTDPEALLQLGLNEVPRVVVAIGEHLEDSILTASNLVEMGVADIWAKADSDAHARILTQLGVHHVIRPERDTGKRVAHLLGMPFHDYAALAEDFGVIKLSAPAVLTHGAFDAAALYRDHTVQVVAVHRDGVWTPVTDGMTLTVGEELVVAGAPKALERVAR